MSLLLAIEAFRSRLVGAFSGWVADLVTNTTGAFKDARVGAISFVVARFCISNDAFRA